MHTLAFPHLPFSKTHRPSQPSTPWIAFKDNYVFLHFFFQLTPISCPTEFSGFNPMLLFLPTRRFWGRSTFTVTVPTVFQRTASQIPKLQMSKLSPLPPLLFTTTTLLLLYLLLMTITPIFLQTWIPQSTLTIIHGECI